MTSRQQVVFGTEVDPDWLPVFTTPGPMELVLAEAMPEMCSEHGLPAVGRREFAVNSAGPLSEVPTMRQLLRSMMERSGLPWFQPDPVVARVRFACPICEFCGQEIRRSRGIAVAALLVVVLTIAGLVAAVSLELSQLYAPLALAVVPGCMPIALLVAVLAWSRSGFFADVWMNQEADELIVSAHPDFVAAVAQCRAERR
ncbi:hypothetical protein [Nocardia asteroides]|uniref:hypothetical protein n=1 Tax=Nocardia asteroides TaxID=1824 RepID=UPI0036543A12